jgi:hypothetical protein
MNSPALKAADLSIGIPSMEAPALRAAIEAILKKMALNAYADGQGRGTHLPLPAEAVFQAIHPSYLHNLPQDLIVMPTQGVRAMFDVFARSLKSAENIFNETVRRLPLDEAVKNQPLLKAAVMLPVPTFNEFRDLISGNPERNIAGNGLQPVFLPLGKEEQFLLTPEAIRAASNEVHKDDGTLLAGFVHISPHSPTGQTFTYKQIGDLYRAIQGLSSARMAKLEKLAGGKERLKKLCQENPEFDWAVTILSRVKIYEDGVYFWSEKAKPTASMLELEPRRFRHARNDVVFAHSVSKIVSAPGVQGGVAVTGPDFFKWLERYSQMPAVGLNNLSYAPLHPVYDPENPYHPELRAYTAALSERLAENRTLVEQLVNGTVNEKTDAPKVIIDPYTEAPWTKGEIPGVRMCQGGDAGMFRLMEFDRNYWQPLINHYVPEAKDNFGEGMYRLLTVHLETRLTSPKEMVYEKFEDNIFRINCDKSVEDIIRGLATLRHAATLLAMPTGGLRQNPVSGQPVIS